VFGDPKSLTLLYPSDPLDTRRPDDAFAEEIEAVSSMGIVPALFQSEGVATGDFRPRPPLAPGDRVVYRGWMLTPMEYETLHAAIERRGGRPITDGQVSDRKKWDLKRFAKVICAEMAHESRERTHET
jgi:hypothetical protein